MRVVLDTNVTLSGLLWNGTPRRVLEAGRNGQIEIFCSAELVEELEDVLQRPKLASRLARIGSTPEELLAGYLALVIVIRAAPLPVPISVDPDDDAVLACALAPAPRRLSPAMMTCSGLGLSSRFPSSPQRSSSIALRRSTCHAPPSRFLLDFLFHQLLRLAHPQIPREQPRQQRVAQGGEGASFNFVVMNFSAQHQYLVLKNSY